MVELGGRVAMRLGQAFWGRQDACGERPKQKAVKPLKTDDPVKSVISPRQRYQGLD